MSLRVIRGERLFSVLILEDNDTGTSASPPVIYVEAPTPPPRHVEPEWVRRRNRDARRGLK